MTRKSTYLNRRSGPVEDRKYGLNGSRNEELTALRIINPSLWRNQIMSALEDQNGNLSATARHLKISRQTLINYLNEDDELDRFSRHINAKNGKQTRRKRHDPAHD